MSRGFDDVPADPELAHAASSARAEWRRDEEEYLRAAEEHWAHQRSLRDVVRELMHRGDTVTATIGTAMFTGRVIAVGDDYFEVDGPADAVDVRLDTLQLIVRVVEQARDGGCRSEPGSRTFRARLLEHEMAGGEVIVGHLAGELRGEMVVGRDQVRVGRQGQGTYVPIAGVTWIQPAGD